MVLIAQRANVPIIPIGIRSSYKPFSKLRIVYGKPISLEEYKAQKLSAEMCIRDRVTASSAFFASSSGFSEAQPAKARASTA